MSTDKKTMHKNVAIALGVVVVAILAVIVFCHIAVWLMWIGLFAVVVLAVWIAVLARRGYKDIQEERERPEPRE